MASDGMLRAYGKMLFSQAAPDVSRDPQLLFARAHFPDDPGAAILDAGCGNGTFARTLARSGHSRILGVDLHESVDTEGLFEYRRTSIDDTGLPDASIDFVYSFSVIYHLPDPTTGFREFWRVMKPGARLAFSAHTRASLFTLDRRIRRRFGGASHLDGVRFPSARQYVGMLEGLGFEVLDVDGFRTNYFAETRPGRIATRLLRGRSPDGASADAPRDPGPAWRRRLRSIFGYHLVIAARKPGGSATSSP